MSLLIDSLKLPSRLASLTLAASLGGCAIIPHFARLASIRPVKAADTQQLSRADGEYASIKAAIIRRDYGTALEMLQSARSRRPDDVRLINAFGVVYDKLGRFDLSARYYAQAKALDPDSPIIANNLSYSAALQAPVPALLSPEARPQELVAAQPPNIQPPSSIAVALNVRAPILTLPPPSSKLGHPLVIADASGSTNGAEPVRSTLIRLGWSRPKLTTEHPEPVTRIEYSVRNQAVAEALARTLPRGVQLVDCSSTCDGVQLVVGADSTKWALSPRGARIQ